MSVSSETGAAHRALVSDLKQQLAVARAEAAKAKRDLSASMAAAGVSLGLA